MNQSYKKTLHTCYLGYITQAIINNLAPLLFVTFQLIYSITLSQLGKLILLNFIIQLTTDFISIKFVDRIGYRKSAVLAESCSAIGLIGMAVFPFFFKNPYHALQLSVIIYAVGGGLLEVIISPIVDSLPTDNKEASMSLLHSFYCWGQVLVVLITTGLLYLLKDCFWFIIPLIWSIIPIITLFLFLTVKMPKPVSETNRIPLRQLFITPYFYLLIVFMICSASAELGMSQWASLFAEEGLGVSKAYGNLLGPCLFAVFMGMGRTYFGLRENKIALERSIFLCSLLCTICYLVTALVSIPLISLLACAVTGFSVSILWPGTFSLATKRFPLGGTAMFSVLALFGDFGCSLSPFLTGTIASYSNLKIGLAVGAIFPFILCSCTAVFLQKSKNTTEI